jgi:hypothetical protein
MEAPVDSYFPAKRLEERLSGRREVAWALRAGDVVGLRAARALDDGPRDDRQRGEALSRGLAAERFIEI